MAIIRFERVVSVTNEIQGHSAKNILLGEIDPKKSWLCKGGSNKGAIILQLERSTIVTSVHIGNAYSAFVEILVGKAADDSDQFESLVPMSSLMSPKDSVMGINHNCTRLFIKGDFSEESCGKAWDRIKVVCSQPFNKKVPFGLCFIQVQGEAEPIASLPKLLEKIAEKKPEDEITVGSFFQKKRSSGGVSKDTGESSSQVEKYSSTVKEIASGRDKIELKDKLEKIEKTSSRKETEKQSGSSLRQKAEDEEHKRKEDKKRDKRKREKQIQKKPFEKLLGDVTIVLSGFQNPLRGNIRNLALEMGAQYSPDWANHCTHLICACENTPKFREVKGKGKIVKKEWLEKCHADRKRYPWRRFALSKKDAKEPESEDEIEAAVESSFCRESENDEKSVSPSKKKKVVKKTKDMSKKNLSRIESLDDKEYYVSTDEDEIREEDTTDYPMPYLLNALAGKVFYVDPNLRSRPLMERYITAYNGKVTNTFDESVEFYLTDKGGPLLDVYAKKVPNIVMVKPSWICEINSKQEYTPPTPHIIRF